MRAVVTEPAPAGEPQALSAKRSKRRSWKTKVCAGCGRRATAPWKMAR